MDPSLIHQIQATLSSLGTHLQTLTHQASRPDGHPATSFPQQDTSSDYFQPRSYASAVSSLQEQRHPTHPSSGATSAHPADFTVSRTVRTVNSSANSYDSSSFPPWPPRAPVLQPTTTSTHPSHTQTARHQTSTTPPNDHVTPLMDVTFAPDIAREFDKRFFGPGRASRSYSHRQVQLSDHVAGTRTQVQGRDPDGPQGPHDSQYVSTNPQFTLLVKAINTGARLLHANANWQQLPTSIHKNLTRICDSIKPPMHSPQFRTHLNQLFNTFQHDIQTLVLRFNDDNLNACTDTFHTLPQDELDAACHVATSQITRTNSRITPDQAKSYIHRFTHTHRHEPHRTTDTNHHPSLAPTSSSSQDTAAASTSTAFVKPSVTCKAQTKTATATPTTNRFAPLGSIDPDVEPDDTHSTTHTHSPTKSRTPPPTTFDISPPRPTRNTPKVDILIPDLPEPTILTAPTCSNPLITHTPSHSTKKRPISSPSSAEVPKKPTLLPTVSLSDIAIVDRSLAASFSSKSPLPPKPHLSDFVSSNRATWQFPEIHPDCPTVLMAASNGVNFAQHTPSTWHTLAYRGARLIDLARMLSKATIPDHVSSIIIACGLNDRTSPSDSSFRSALILLNSIFSARSAITFRLCHIPQFHMAPHQLKAATTRLNTLITDILGESKRLIPLPRSFLAYTRTRDDWSHLNLASCSEFITLLLDHIHSLN